MAEAGESSRRRDAVHARHLNIHQDQVERHLFGPFHGLMPLVAQLHVEPYPGSTPISFRFAGLSSTAITVIGSLCSSFSQRQKGL